MDTGLKSVACTLLHLDHVMLMNWVLAEEEFLEPQWTEHGRGDIQKRRNSVTEFFGGDFPWWPLFIPGRRFSLGVSVREKRPTTVICQEGKAPRTVAQRAGRCPHPPLLGWKICEQQYAV